MRALRDLTRTLTRGINKCISQLICQPTQRIITLTGTLENQNTQT